MSKPITMSEAQWEHLRAQLTKDHKPSVMLLSYRTKEVLGFTVRTHVWYDEPTRRYKDCVCLDFYNEPKRTMFLLRYSEYLAKNGITTA